MRSDLVLAALLCFTTWMSIVHATHGPVGNRCCLQWSTTRVPLQRIMNYTIQSEGVCPIKATMFMTVKGKTLCSDPNSAWAVKAMRKVDEETKKKALQEQGQNEDGSTSDVTPAASTASKKAPRRKGRSGRRRKGRKFRRGRKGQRKRV